MDTLPGAAEVHMSAGDAVAFTDSVMHGASSRTNPGERRVVIIRYGPSWSTSRFGYDWSDALLERLTDERRRVLRPVPRMVAGSSWIPFEAPRTQHSDRA
jgi:ectoine hydroxylase-related dioxygenase (phytanoyl-CoA dioxygenase family)